MGTLTDKIEMTPDKIKTIILFHIMDCVLDDDIKYVAIDNSGWVYAYLNKPRLGNMTWESDVYDTFRRMFNTIDCEKYGFDWKESLVKL